MGRTLNPLQAVHSESNNILWFRSYFQSKGGTFFETPGILDYFETQSRYRHHRLNDSHDMNGSFGCASLFDAVKSFYVCDLRTKHQKDLFCNCNTLK